MICLDETLLNGKLLRVITMYINLKNCIPLEKHMYIDLPKELSSSMKELINIHNNELKKLS